MTSFAGRHVLVTGAATGIGRATAEYLHENGARVFGVGLDGDAGRAVHAGKAPGLSFRETDLTDSTAVIAAVAEMMARFPRLDAVVNCAGIYATGKRLEDLSDAEWQLTLDVNLGAIFKGCRATLPLLRAPGGASVVNIASFHPDATRPLFPS